MTFAMLLQTTFLLALVLSATALEVRSIDDYGAVANDSSVSASFKNSAAIVKALQAAAKGDAVLVPPYKKYFIYPAMASGLRGIQLWIEGELIAQSNISAWPNDGKSYYHLLYLQDCRDIIITGKTTGRIDGQGFKWWVELMFNLLPYSRPKMLVMENCIDVLIENISASNSPSFHMDLRNMTNLIVRNVHIWVNVTAQKALTKTKLNPWGIPMFPFNTDGIDPSGRNILIQNITVENYDDAVAVKPMQLLNGGCTENITVENSRVVIGVGMSIGSVPPNSNINCIRNVTFRNIDFEYPIKAIYVKTNSGKNGHGIIDNILYENIRIRSPVLWAVYIGPQQQYEPNGGGDGLWPPPQPLVNVTRITLRNVTSEKGWLNAGVLRCAASNPCKEFVFDSVQVKGWLAGFYICENIQGLSNHSDPQPMANCKKPDEVPFNYLLSHMRFP